MGCATRLPLQDDADIDYTKAGLLNVELAYRYLAEGQTARAKSKLLKAQQLAPQLPNVYTANGVFLETVGEIAAAHKSHLKAVNMNPQQGDAHHQYGLFLCRQGDFLAAETAFLAAIHNPRYIHTAKAYQDVGTCLQQAGDNVKAAMYFEKSKNYSISPTR